MAQLEVGQVRKDSAGVLRRVTEIVGRRAFAATLDGGICGHESWALEMDEHLAGHPWGNDREWQPGDTYAQRASSDGRPHRVARVRNGVEVEWIARSDIPIGCDTSWCTDTKWGKSLTFDAGVMWQLNLSSEQPSADAPSPGLIEVAHSYGVKADATWSQEDIYEAVQIAMHERGESECECHNRPPCGWCTGGAQERIDELAEVIDGPASSEPLTREQLIAQVSALCPPDLCEPAWRYAVARLVSRWEKPQPLTACDMKHEIASPGALGGRLYNDGLREHALQLLLDRRPDDLALWGWERVCRWWVSDYGPPSDVISQPTNEARDIAAALTDASSSDDQSRQARAIYDTAPRPLDIATRGPHGDEL